ncbi:MAG: DUF3362 domain-containing protein [Steroidobacteraceae bacterium]
MRRLHKAFLRYHDANNWPMLREALRRMGRSDLIGNGNAAAGSGLAAGQYRRRAGRPTTFGARAATRPFRNQHTGFAAYTWGAARQAAGGPGR